MARTIEMRCTTCGSTNVSMDAAAEWDPDQQGWVLSTTYDHTWCNSDECDGADATLATYDADTGEELRMAPKSFEYLPKAEADALWEEQQAIWRADRDARAAEREKLEQIAETTNILAAASQEIHI